MWATRLALNQRQLMTYVTVRAMQVLAVLVIRDQAERAKNVHQSVNDLNAVRIWKVAKWQTTMI
jgi:hypothetical protein